MTAGTFHVLTPSYRPDLEGFKRLHASVLRHTDSSTMHHAIVPARDLGAFRSIPSPRLTVWAESDFLPSGFVATGWLSAVRQKVPLLPRTVNCAALNVRRPWPPLRGWILQQILKLSASTKLGCDAVVVIDSDVVLVRPMPTGTYFRNGTVRLYEKDGAVTSQLERHMLWTQTAHDLLGLPWTAADSYPDYVGGIVSWDPRLVAGCLARIEDVKGIGWAQALSRNLHFSEFILYGTFVRHFGSAQDRSFTASQTLCHSYWAPEPLVLQDADAFADRYSRTDLAVHIQSNSGTAADVVERVVARIGPGA